MKNLSEYSEHEVVEVLIHNPQTKRDEWRKATITGKGCVYPTNYSRHSPYPYITVEVERTYYRKIRDKFVDILWVGEEGEFFNKTTTERFYHDDQVRPINKEENLVVSK